MKNTDLFSKRFLSVTLGISALLLSGSLFLFSLNNVGKAKAGGTGDIENIIEYAKIKDLNHVKSVSQDDEDIRAIQAFGIGIREGDLYFGILYNNNTIGLHRSPADSEDVLDW